VKIKCTPEDFQVFEQLRIRLKRTGPFSIYRLQKRFWNTLDVIRELEQRHGLRRIGRAGLKDRYSVSTQYISIPGRGPGSIREKNYSLEFAGMADEPVSRELLLGNNFDITIRALTADETSAIEQALPSVIRFGFPNYYDEQRLGSARHGQGFIARKLIDGHFNGALKLYLATPSPADDTKTRRTKSLISENWGHWVECMKLVRPEARPVIQHLIQKPKDFKGAVGLIPRNLLELFVGAYQAWVWNETMSATLRSLGVPTRTVEYSHGSLAFWNKLSPEHEAFLSQLVIPAVGPGAEFPGERIARIAAEVLSRDGLTLEALKMKVRVHGVFFKAYQRRARIVPEHVKVTKPVPDDIYPGRSMLTLSLFLPAGSYATILLKRLSLL
jgi:tRNA pseudouridine13 synthase